MDTISQFFQSNGIEIRQLLIAGAVFLVGLLVLGSLSRFIYGKRSTLTRSISSAIGILFIYALTVVIKVLFPDFEWLTAQLPFVTFTQDTLHIFAFVGYDYTVICSELLSMVILAFLMNLADRWLPAGKKFFGWLFFRCLTVILGFLMHSVVSYLFSEYLPGGIVTYAPAILLGLLILLLLTGCLKFIVGLIVSTVNPIIAGLYTFFFANVVGKMITKAVLTTALLCLIVFALNQLGILAFVIAPAALIAYVPFLILLAALWYLVGHIF